MFKKIISIFLLCAISFSCCSCVSRKSPEPISANPGENNIALTAVKADNEFVNAYNNFSAEIFKSCFDKDENTLISPLSVFTALSMTANGAKEETLAQFNSLLGMDIEKLNGYLYDYIENLPSSDGFKLNLANSLWIKENYVEVKKEFVSLLSECYKANVYESAFDKNTAADINAWVSEHTDKMIKKIIDEIPEDVFMYIINAIVFDSEWKNKYEKYDIEDGYFNNSNGTNTKVQMMNSYENKYYEDSEVKGFIKEYKDGYSFVAFLTNDANNFENFANSLSGEKITKMLSSFTDDSVKTVLPQFKYEYENELSEELKGLGLTNAFDKKLSDFSNINDEWRIFINRVIHKTFIDVNADGTKAAAVTAVELDAESCVIDEKVIYLNRPFVYMIIDNSTNMPIFIGTLVNAD